MLCWVCLLLVLTQRAYTCRSTVAAPNGMPACKEQATCRHEFRHPDPSRQSGVIPDAAEQASRAILTDCPSNETCVALVDVAVVPHASADNPKVNTNDVALAVAQAVDTYTFQVSVAQGRRRSHRVHVAVMTAGLYSQTLIFKPCMGLNYRHYAACSAPSWLIRQMSDHQPGNTSVFASSGCSSVSGG